MNSILKDKADKFPGKILVKFEELHPTIKLKIPFPRSCNPLILLSMKQLNIRTIHVSGQGREGRCSEQTLPYSFQNDLQLS